MKRHWENQSSLRTEDSFTTAAILLGQSRNRLGRCMGQSRTSLGKMDGDPGTYSYNGCEDTLEKQILPKQHWWGPTHVSTAQGWDPLNGWATTFTIYTTQTATYLHLRWPWDTKYNHYFSFIFSLKYPKYWEDWATDQLHGVLTMVWIVCPSACHGDTWGQARSQDSSWRIVLGKESQSGWSASKGEKSYLLSDCFLRGKASGESLGGNWHRYSEDDQDPSRKQNKPGSQCMSHVQFMHKVLLKTFCFMYA